jgi:probable F420-dependent oxidoreductase
VFLAGVNERMTEVAGEVCDGFVFHPFTTARYLHEVTRPALARGAAAAGRSLDDFTVAGPAFVAVGRDDAELATAVAATKAQIAFYASTPAYRPVLELHGWGDLQPRLGTLTRQGRWGELGDLIDDDVLHEFAVVGRPTEVGAAVRARFADVATRLSLYVTYPSDPAMWPEVLTALRG